MASTTFYAVPLPTVGADADAWGGENNTLHSSWDRILNGAARAQIWGLTLSAAGSTATFGIAAGVAADTANTDMLALASAYTKTTSSWAVGTGNGALDTGVIANSTWYHAYLIKRTDTGVVDVLVSADPAAPALPTGYTLSRRIGAMKTDGSAQWVKFVQNGDKFLWDAPVQDVAGVTLGAVSTLYALSVPTGVKVDALFNAAASATGSVVVLVQSPNESTQVANTPAGNFSFSTPGSSNFGAAPMNVGVNTSAQIRAVGNTSGITFYVNTHGWLDRRGKDN